ncbi:sigma-70 family RNA polymerase sigma factor [Candidatus Woesearchaeota archaeon]|nr:sigma-70 family RNA polymerase sigma factor [Candidatus Woesearchaeota archaeon]
MGKQSWSAEKIGDALIDIYTETHQLTKGVIREKNPLLPVLIFHYTKSIKNAREVAAKKLENIGEISSAKDIRNLNLYGDKAYTHLKEFVNLIIDNEEKLDLYKPHLETQHPNLLFSLKRYFRGYYNALPAAAKLLQEWGNPELAERVGNIEYWQNYGKILRSKKRKEKEKGLEQILEIKYDRNYSSQDIHSVIEFKGTKEGKEIVELLKGSGEWLTTSEMSKELEMCIYNVSKLVPLEFPDRVIKYPYHTSKTGFAYLYHCSIKDLYEKKGKSCEKGSIFEVATRLGVSDTKIRGIVKNMGLGCSKGKGSIIKKIILSEDEINTLKEIIDKRSRDFEDSLENIEPGEGYSCGELNKRGIPSSHFLKGAREGQVPYSMRNGVKTFEGSLILDFFENQYYKNYLLTGLRSATLLYPHLYTPPDIQTMFRVNLGHVHRRLNTLLKENPEACYRLRKTRNRRILATEETIPILKNWNQRHNFRLLNKIYNIRKECSKEEVHEALRDIEELKQDDGTFHYQDNKQIFENLSILKDFQHNLVNLGKVELTQRDLALVYCYMDYHKYKILEMERDYTLEEVKELSGDFRYIESVIKTIQRTSFLLQHANMGLVHKNIKDNIEYIRGLVKRYLHRDIMDKDYDLFYNAEMEALGHAVKNFEDSKGKFPTYAIKIMNRMIERHLERESRYKREGKYTHTSLSTPIGKDNMEKRCLVDILEYSQQSADEMTAQSELEDKLRDVIAKVKLYEIERKVIEFRFPQNGSEAKTLKEIGDEFNLSIERIRQIQNMALSKLRSLFGDASLTDYI